MATFAAGFFTRPLGSVLLGVYADRRGRRAALNLTIMLMAIGTGLIAIAPTYAQIGVFAPLIIVFARLLQGFSQGGEFGAPPPPCWNRAIGRSAVSARAGSLPRKAARP